MVKGFYRMLLQLSPAWHKQQQTLRAFYSTFIHPGDLVFDVGANAGDRTAVFLQIGAHVVAVDPQPVCAEKLRRRFKGESRVSLVEKALGAKLGEAEMNLSDADTISSLSAEWIAKVKASGRFAKYQWQKTIKVPITTLDRLIEEFGCPVFCKIDVEGFEDQVLQGLTHKIATLSFEFTPEYLEPAFRCLNLLDTLGNARFNYSVGETMQLALSEWITAQELRKVLTELKDKTVFGDVYAKLN
jgi:FkbM family methyltransferase